MHKAWIDALYNDPWIACSIHGLHSVKGPIKFWLWQHRTSPILHLFHKSSAESSCRRMLSQLRCSILRCYKAAIHVQKVTWSKTTAHAQLPSLNLAQTECNPWIVCAKSGFLLCTVQSMDCTNPWIAQIPRLQLYKLGYERYNLLFT